jgi:hypothetical protein
VAERMVDFYAKAIQRIKALTFQENSLGRGDKK